MNVAAPSLSPREMERIARNVNPGGWAVETEQPIATLLGSCVTVCLYDPHLRIGGLNHFMLPKMSSHAADVDALLGGDYNMEALINGMFARGARRSRLVAKAFGGGAVIDSLVGGGIGERNVAFAREWLEREGIPLLAGDMLGPWSRKVVFDPLSGDAFCRRIVRTQAITEQIARSEAAYQRELAQQKHQASNVELF